VTAGYDRCATRAAPMLAPAEGRHVADLSSSAACCTAS
jgi:hypothetical protein